MSLVAKSTFGTIRKKTDPAAKTVNYFCILSIYLKFDFLFDALLLPILTELEPASSRGVYII